MSSCRALRPDALEAIGLRYIRDLDCIPGRVVNLAGVFVDVVVMVVGLWIGDHSTFGENEPPKQPFFHEQVESGVQIMSKDGYRQLIADFARVSLGYK